MALRSGSPIHFLSMQAAGENFYLGGEPATYCPSVVSSCPLGNNETVIAGGYALVCLSRNILALRLQYTKRRKTVCRSSRRPAAVRRSGRCVGLHASPFHQYARRLHGRSVYLYPRLTHRPLHLRWMGCVWVHGMSRQRGESVELAGFWGVAERDSADWQRRRLSGFRCLDFIIQRTGPGLAVHLISTGGRWKLRNGMVLHPPVVGSFSKPQRFYASLLLNIAQNKMMASRHGVFRECCSTLFGTVDTIAPSREVVICFGMLNSLIVQYDIARTSNIRPLTLNIYYR